MASMIADLLKTPQQVRQERQDAMRQNSLAQAALLSRGASGSTALPGLLRGFAAQQLVEQAPQMENTVRRGLGAAGMLGGAVGALTPQQVQATQQLGIPQEEQRAMQLNALAREATSTDPAKLKETADKLRAAGRSDIAAQLDERAKELEQAATQTKMRQAYSQYFENQGRSDLAGMALDPSVNIIDLVKEARLSKEKPEDDGVSDLPTSAEMAFYMEQTGANEQAEAKIESMTNSGWKWYTSDEEEAKFSSLKNKAIAIAHQRSGGKVQEFDKEYNTLINQYYNQWTQEQEAQRAKEKAKTTPIDVPGLQELDEAAGFEEQTNPFATTDR